MMRWRSWLVCVICSLPNYLLGWPDGVNKAAWSVLLDWVYCLILIDGECWRASKQSIFEAFNEDQQTNRSA